MLLQEYKARARKKARDEWQRQTGRARMQECENMTTRTKAVCYIWYSEQVLHALRLCRARDAVVIIIYIYGAAVYIVALRLELNK